MSFKNECNVIHYYQNSIKSQTFPNIIEFLDNTSEIMSSIQIQSEKYIKISKKVLSNTLTVLNSTPNETIIDSFLEHDGHARVVIEKQ